MNRALRAATLCVALLSPVALSACSAGQVTQTATQQRDKTGGMAEVGDLTLRQIQLVNPRGGSYDAGDDVDLRLTIVNSGQETDTLTSIEGDGFGSAEITGTTTAARSGGAPLGDLSVGTASGIEVPAGTTLAIGEDDLTITLTDLDDSLTVGQYLTLVLNFENAGEVTVQATVATPSRAIQRAESFDFHHEEEEGGEAAGEIARERESEQD